MLEIIGYISQEKQQSIIEHLQELPLTPDVSNYAKGRHRLWIGTEPYLGTDRSKDKPSYQDERIVNYCKGIFRSSLRVDYILVTYSTEQAIGIDWHRDASYCSNLAGTINLGAAKFGIKDRQGTEGSEQFLDLTGGEVVVFHSKHPHFCQPSANRWAIHCWQSK